MKIKNFFYEEPDGIHFPDTFRGSEEVYEVDFTRFLRDESAVLLNVMWDVDARLGLVDTYPHESKSNVVCAVIRTLEPGSFMVRCTAELLHGQVSELVPVELRLKVF